MDFNFSEEQNTVRDLARGILEKEVTPERVGQVEKQPGWHDSTLWQTLADTGLLGLAVAEEHGGMGYGFPELCMLLGELGRVVAPAPAIPTLVLGALPIAELGSAEQQAEWLPRVVSGEAILTAALTDAGSPDQAPPATRAHREGGGWLLNGTKTLVPVAHQADCLLIPATAEEGIGFFLVDPKTPGVTVTPSLTSRGDALCEVVLENVQLPDSALLGGGLDASCANLVRLYQHALVATSITQVSVCERAVQIAAEYLTGRIQFGVPLGSFQAVQHRMADAYIDLESMRWTAWRAALVLADGRNAEREAMVAKFWAAEAGARIAASVQHLHGGIGIDLDYLVHRYFLWSKTLELQLGGGPETLARLGRNMAENPPQELS